MSDEEPTKRFDTEDRTIQPMLETLLREFRSFRVEMTEFRTKMSEFRTETNARFAKLEQSGEHADVRLDRIESLANQTRAEMLGLRADFKDLSAQLRESLPSLVK
ncbi:MAG: hypothetical protein MSG64_15110 [Pyrinomonadaceae bacterium MAG19_C2-C3]|nr:hypothetical protein [Pyrinomonadaceae bacterium MAG19_C2-C3]